MQQNNNHHLAGCLYVVATPIGNLAEMSQRAIEVLTAADLILAEDTRHSQKLLNAFAISSKMISLHEHNERQRVKLVLDKLQAKKQLALISDAGTPLISDPGYVLVTAVRAAGYKVSPVAGPCSIIAALSVAAMPSDAFIFDGFLPAKSAARSAFLARYQYQKRTVIVLESSHRIVNAVADIVQVLGADRQLAVAKELTKVHEHVANAPAQTILEQLQNAHIEPRGEFVIIIGKSQQQQPKQQQLEQVLAVLLEQLATKQAAQLGAQICNCSTNYAYQLALELKNKS